MKSINGLFITQTIKQKLQAALELSFPQYCLPYEFFLHDELKMCIDIQSSDFHIAGSKFLPAKDKEKVTYITVSAVNFEFTREAKGWAINGPQYFHPSQIDQAIEVFIKRIENNANTAQCVLPYGKNDTSMEAVYAIQKELSSSVKDRTPEDPGVKKYRKQAKESLEQAMSIINSDVDEVAVLQQIRQAALQAEKAAADLNTLYGIIYAKGNK